MPEGLHLDMSGATLSFEPMEVGTYDAHVAEVKETVSKASGQPNLAWTFEIDEEPYEGRKLFCNTSLQPQALWKLGQYLMALGWDEEEISAEEGFDLELEDLADLPCRVVVSQDEYQGQVRNRVDSVLPPSSSEPLLDEHSLADWDAAEAEPEEFEITF